VWTLANNLGILVRPRIVARLAHPSPKNIQIKNFDSYVNHEYKLLISNYAAKISSFVIGKSSFNLFTVRTNEEIQKLNQPYKLFQIGVKFGIVLENGEFLEQESLPEMFYYPHDLLTYEHIKKFEMLKPTELIQTKKGKLFYIIENKEISKPKYYLYSSWSGRKIKVLDVKENKFTYLKVHCKWSYIIS
jgi:hypothetical protein